MSEPRKKRPAELPHAFQPAIRPQFIGYCMLCGFPPNAPRHGQSQEQSKPAPPQPVESTPDERGHTCFVIFDDSSALCVTAWAGGELPPRYLRVMMTAPKQPPIELRYDLAPQPAESDGANAEK